MDAMFFECNSLKSINLQSFITKKVRYMGGMFSHCYSLTSINISNFYINNSVGIDGMFSYCKNLTFIDISSFHINTCHYSTFYKLPNNGQIFVSNDLYNYINESLPNWDIIINDIN